MWAERPLPQHMLELAVFNVSHLLSLKLVLAEKMMTLFIKGVDIYLSCVRDSTDSVAKNTRVKFDSSIIVYEMSDKELFKAIQNKVASVVT